MAIVHKCDRCGALIDKTSAPRRKFVHKTYANGSLLYHFLIGGDLEAECVKDIELCPTCNESFIDWFLRGKKEEVANEDPESR